MLSCEFCSTKHSKMKCPKLHYMPMKQIIVYRHLEDVKRGTCERQYINRIPKLS